MPLAVVVAEFERSRIVGVSTSIAGVDDSHASGARLTAALSHAGLRTVLAFASGIAANGAALVAGMHSVLPEHIPISGGLAGDDSRFERTWVCADGTVSERAAVAVGLYGEALRIGRGCDGGWRDFGPMRTITRAEGNVLHEQDCKPALAPQKNDLGELASRLPGTALLFPMSLQTAAGGGAIVVRTILGIDENSRHLIMGERTDEELEPFLQSLPQGSALSGFYSYGGTAPSAAGIRGMLHNQTMTGTVIGEAS